MVSRIIWLGNVKPTKNRINPNQGRVYDINGCAPALNTCGGGNLEPFIVEKKYINQLVCENQEMSEVE